MPYTAEISRARRSCLLFLIDQSASMEDRFGGDAARQKKHGVADAIKRLLHTLILRCTTSQGVKHAYDLGVVGYGKEFCGVTRQSVGIATKSSAVEASWVAD